MSKSFRIHGGTPLNGDVTISGYKNAATPIAVAALLGDGPSVLSNVPRASDETLVRPRQTPYNAPMCGVPSPSGPPLILFIGCSMCKRAKWNTR